MAADLIDAVAGELGVAAPSVTRDVPLLDDRAERAALLADRPELAAPLERGAHLHAEVVHACTHEGALHLEDVLERRTRLALTAPDRGLDAAAPAAALMAGALDWDADRTRREVDAWHARVEAARAAEAERDDDRALAAHDAVLAERDRAAARMTELVVGLDQGTSSTRCVVLDEALSRARRGVGGGRVVVPRARARRAGRGGDRGVGRAGDRRRAGGGGRRAGRRRRARHRQPDRDVRGVGPRDRRARPSRDRVAGPADRRRVRRPARARGASSASAPGSSSTPPSRRRSCAGCSTSSAREDGDLAYGDVASWLLHRLGGVHVCDAGNAGRSLLCPLGGADWDDELLDLFGIPRALLPPIADSDRIDATIAGVPVRAAVGDQQASLFGLRCWEPGAAKVTLGTGAFVLAHAGDGGAGDPPAGVLGSTAWRREGTTSYALEGFIPTAGAAVDWFARLGVLPPPQQLDDAAARGRRRPCRLRAGAPGPRHPELGRERPRRPARPQPRHHPRRPRPRGRRRRPPPGRRRGRGDRGRGAVGRRRPLALGLDRPAARRPRGRRRPPHRPRRLDRPRRRHARRASPRASGPSPEALPEIPLDLCAEPQMAAADRDRERDRWAAARELTAPNDLPS